MRRLMILGAGGYSRTVADLAAQLERYNEIAFLDDEKTGEGILGTCGEYGKFRDGNTEFYPAFGNNAVRMNWICRFLEEGIPVPTLVHPRSFVSPRAALGSGTVVLPMAVVNTGTMVGRGCIVNIGALIDHDCCLEDGVHLCPGVIIKAENHIEANTKLESGTVILARKHPVCS